MRSIRPDDNTLAKLDQLAAELDDVNLPDTIICWKKEVGNLLRLLGKDYGRLRRMETAVKRAVLEPQMQ
jgi:hypothetical protein